jgi:hypothetical protein
VKNGFSQESLTNFLGKNFWMVKEPLQKSFYELQVI